jgi:butyryl-CoA dehydrogenase
VDFELNDEQQLIREAVREFAQAEAASIAPELDRDHRFPYELLPKLAAAVLDELRPVLASET